MFLMSVTLIFMSSILSSKHFNFLRNPGMKILVNSPNTNYGPSSIKSEYEYDTTRVEIENGTYRATPVTKKMIFETKTKVPKTG